jgi:hypothetical protein
MRLNGPSASEIEVIRFVCSADGGLSETQVSFLGRLASQGHNADATASAGLDITRNLKPEDLSASLDAFIGTPDSHLLVLEAMMLALLDGPPGPNTQEALAELLALFRYDEQRTEWVTTLALGLTNCDGALVAACYENPPPGAPTLVHVRTYAPGLVLPDGFAERDAGEVCAPKGVIDRDTTLDRDLTINLGDTLRVVGAILTLRGEASIVCEGHLVIEDATLRTVETVSNRRMIEVGAIGSLNMSRTRVDGGSTRPGIASLGGALWMTDCQFTDLTAEDADIPGGGAIHWWEGLTDFPFENGLVRGCTFERCRAGEGGGAINLFTSFDKGPLTRNLIQGCRFTDCHAGDAGGAICLDLPHVLLAQVEQWLEDAPEVEPPSVTISLPDCEFRNCTPDMTNVHPDGWVQAGDWWQWRPS